MGLYPGIKNGRPNNPDYSMMRERQATFTDWSTKGISFKCLAQAGFYATGNRDCVRCFYCGIGMKDWQQDDDPWIEHVELSPHCQYVNLCMGEDLIKKTHNLNEHETQKLTRGLVEENLVPDQLIEDLNSQVSRLLMDKGFKQEDVEQAIQKSRGKHGSVELRVHLLHEFLLENDTVSKSHEEQSTYASVGLKKSNRASFGENTFKKNTFDTEEDRLLEENRTLIDRMKCKICLDNEACALFTPCGHMVSCMECARRQSKCAVCRAEIKETIRVYSA